MIHITRVDNGLAETASMFFYPEMHCQHGLSMAFTLQSWALVPVLTFWSRLATWRQSGVKGTLQFTSFEAFPLLPKQMIKAHEAFPKLKNWPPNWHHFGHSTISLPDLQFQLILGDARDTLPNWHHKADAWFLDGFSPAKNPDIWEPALMAQVADHTKQGGSCATYTAAGFVRRGLQAGGFLTTRTAGFGRKRHMTQGKKP